MRKQKVIIIEDDESWEKLLKEVINKHFELDIESFLVFQEGKKRLEKGPPDFDLLIADVFHNPQTRVRMGLIIANFTQEVLKKKVIIVTGADGVVTEIQQEYNFLGVFDKGTFDEMIFVDCVKKVIKLKKKHNGNQGDKKKQDENPGKDNKPPSGDPKASGNPDPYMG